MSEKRMVAAEQAAYLNLLAAIHTAKKQEEALARRMSKLPNAKRCMHSGIGMLNRLMVDIDATIPAEQKAHFERQKQGLRMIVGIKAQMPRDPDAEHGRFLSFKQLDVVANAIRECCRVCDLTDAVQQAKCPYAKLLDELPTTKPDEDAPGCGYFTIWGGF
jgi:hypothetical protein